MTAYSFKKAKPYRLIISLCMFFVLVFITGCSNEVGSLRDLLGTVPSEAGVVGVVNMKDMVMKSGLNNESNFNAIENIIDNKDAQDVIKLILEGSGGIEVTWGVIFTDGSRNYVTGLLNDAHSFKKMIEDKAGTNFRSEDGVDICEEIAVYNGQFWIVDKSIDPLKIKEFSKLDEKGSVLGTPVGEELMRIDNDIEVMANVNSLINQSMLSVSDLGMLRLALGAVFSDPKYLKITIEFERGEAEADIFMLNSKGTPAEFLLPEGRISERAIRELPGSGNVVLAASVPEKLTTMIENLAGSFGTNMDFIFSPLRCIDGTIAVIAENEDIPLSAISGVIETNNTSTEALTSFLSISNFNTRQEGKYVFFSSDYMPSGSLSGKDVASELRDNFIAVAINGKSMVSQRTGERKLSMIYITLGKERESLKAKIKVETTKRNENILKTLCSN